MVKRLLRHVSAASGGVGQIVGQRWRANLIVHDPNGPAGLKLADQPGRIAAALHVQSIPLQPLVDLPGRARHPPGRQGPAGI